MLVNARRAERSRAGANRHLPLLEVGQEGIPFLVGRSPVLLTRAGGTTPRDERPVRLDRFGGIHGLWRRQILQLSECLSSAVCSADRVWIVDPLAGTREISELGRAERAVHVALWQSGELVAGAVALPAQGITLATPTVSASAAQQIVVSRTRPSQIALAVCDGLNGTLVEMGSVKSEGRLRHRGPR
jgi:Inositol monophosphatase family